MTNDLVAAPKNETEWYTGVPQIEEIVSLSDSIDSGDWLEVATSGSSLSMDAMTMVFDPVGALGILVQAGLGWVIEHVKPLKQTLDDLAGDPPVIKSYGETWKNVAGRLKTVAAQHAADAKADLGGWTGKAAARYQAKARERADSLDAASRACATVGAAVLKAGAAVATVRMLVRDTLTALVSALIEACLPPGGGTLKAVGKISKAAAKISRYVGKLTRSLTRLSEELDKLAGALGRLVRRLRTTGDGGVPTTRPSSVTRQRKTGAGPATTPSRAPTRTGPPDGTTPSHAPRTNTPDGPGTTPAFARPGGGRHGIGQPNDWFGRTNPHTGRPFQPGTVRQEVEALRREVLRANDIGKVQRELRRLGLDVDRNTIARIKQYNFDHPGLELYRETYDAWRRLATGKGTVGDARYIVHEMAELDELEKIRRATGFDHTGRRFDELSYAQRREWLADFDRAYERAHDRALKVEYDFIADRVERMTNGQVKVGPVMAAVADPRDEGIRNMVVDGVRLRDHHRFDEWSRAADERRTVSAEVQRRLGLTNPHPTLRELIERVKASKW